ncbi:galectin-related protein-like isoform X3 [Petromyzon marinus]|uniref:galectin-related protein-like isoform X3 n=1 Tax=Petromyzon marinus TaxID=7757 RepID=UPI003F6E7558
MWGTPRAPSLQTSPAPAPRAPRLQPRREARGGRARSRATAPPRRSGQQAGAMKRHGADFAPPHQDDGDEERSEGPLQLPFAGRIKTGIRPGMRIMVTAIVSKHPKSFAIELACGSEEGADVALRLEVHFPGRTIARNAMLGGQWGADETSVPYFPFTPGQPFKCELLCEHERFRVTVDQQNLCGFCHRLQPLHSINSVRVRGDLRLTKVT